MTKEIRDIPMGEGEDIAHRLKTARQNARMTRKQLAEATGIPASTIEKYERGDMDPNTKRLQAICKALDTCVDWMLNGTGDKEITSSTPPTPSIVNTPEPSLAETEDVGKPSHFQRAENLLAELEEMRLHGFQNSGRAALATASAAEQEMAFLEGNALAALAEIYGLYPDPNFPEASAWAKAFASSFTTAEMLADELVKRLIDTAILGRDLYAIDRDALVPVVDALDNESPVEAGGFFGWGEHGKFVPAIRSRLWAKAAFGTGADFSDQTNFPARS